MRAIAIAAAAALVAGALAAPAEARGRNHWHHHDDIDGGDVVAGALVVGGLAAIFSAIGEGNNAKQDAAVETCSREAEGRHGGRVAEIGHVGKSKGYYTVEGVIEAGWDPNEAGADAPAAADGPRPTLPFTCTVRNGTIYSFRTAAS
jgi:hypothetical protein